MLIRHDIPINGSFPLERGSDSRQSRIQTGVILFPPVIPITDTLCSLALLVPVITDWALTGSGVITDWALTGSGLYYCGVAVAYWLCFGHDTRGSQVRSPTQ